MTTANTETTTGIVFDECPECGGTLRHQTIADTECEDCREVFQHTIHSGDLHRLWKDDEVVEEVEA